MDAHEVTVARFRQFVDAGLPSLAAAVPYPGGYFVTPQGAAVVPAATSVGDEANWSTAPAAREDHPLNRLSWDTALAFCVWDGGRLPTELEWESSARGTDERVYAWGEDWSPEKANSIEGRVLRPSPVGAYAPAGGVGPFKAEDQIGNVWEWTTSLYLPYPYQPEKAEDPEAAAERVVRGGAWYDIRGLVRCAARYRLLPDYFLFTLYIGFRVVSPG